MAGRAPKTLSLDPDGHHAEFVGRCADGRQFFLTSPFVPALGGPGREFLALYVFDAAGVLVDATIDDLGPRAEVDLGAAIARRDELADSLGRTEAVRITIAPFRVERYGVEFGFVTHPPNDEVDEWRVTVEPGDYMAFKAPWHRGDYET